MNMTPTTYIALVDDHILLRNSLAVLINSFDGFKVLLEADNGKDFIEQIKGKKEPEIILLDITMPLMNGYETAKWCRVNLPCTKILVLSMMDNDTSIITMLKYGAKGYLLKDSKPPVLKTALLQIRDAGFYINDLVSSRMLNYVNNHADVENDLDSLSVCLTDRELVFLRYACSEKTYREIAAEMFVSVRTVEGYRDALFDKLGITSRVGLAIYAIKNGIVPL
jgi:DNA-binding NarL/FixJ family response regulator